MINRFNNKYRISSIRLPHWNYSLEGYYYVTICTKDKKCVFGEVKEGKMILSEIGIIVYKYWFEIPKHFPNIELDMFQVMPNHVHGIIIIVETRHGTSLQKNNIKNYNSGSLPVIMNQFKGIVTKICRIKLIPFSWLPRFYEHIIRTERELFEIREYIENNPLKWELDEENPKRKNNLIFVKIG